MRKLALLLLVASLAVVAAACGSKKEERVRHDDRSRELCQERPQPRHDRSADDRHRQPRVPALVRRRRRRLAMEGQRPAQRQGLRERGRLRGRETARLRARAEVEWTYVPFNNASRRAKEFDFDINQVSSTPARAKAVTSAAPTTRSTRPSSSQGHEDRVVHDARRHSDVQARRPDRHDELRVHQGHDQAVEEAVGYPTNAGAVQALKNRQIDGLVVDLPTAFYVTSAQVPNGEDPRPAPDASLAASTSGSSSRRAARSSRA